MPFSFEKRLERGDTRGDLCRHVIVRGLLLVFIGHDLQRAVEVRLAEYAVSERVGADWTWLICSQG